MLALMVEQPSSLTLAQAARVRSRAMRDAYAKAGGLLHGQQLIDKLRNHYDQPISLLARWIVQRRIVSFDLEVGGFVPMFQFKPESMELRPVVAEVVRELAPAFDDWELASWFVEPNAYTFGLRPIDLIQSTPATVVRAARTDCLFARELFCVSSDDRAA